MVTWHTIGYGKKYHAHEGGRAALCGRAPVNDGFGSWLVDRHVKIKDKCLHCETILENDSRGKNESCC